MAGSIGMMLRDLNLETVESLSEDFDPITVINDPLPPIANDASHINGVKSINGKKKPREIVLGRNVHTTWQQQVAQLTCECV